MKILFVTAFCAVMGVALPAIAPSSAYANETTQEQSAQPGTDTWITTKVKSELATTKGVKSMGISVKTVDGVVTLTGTQPDQAAIDKAVAAAQKVKGVQRVDSTGLTVGQ